MESESIESLSVTEVFPSKHLNNEISVTGVVTSMTPIRTETKVKVFVCNKCGSRNKIKQHTSKAKIQEPDECIGCERISEYSVNWDKSKVVKKQSLRLEDPETNIGDNPLTIWVDEEKTQSNSIGDKIQVSGKISLTSDDELVLQASEIQQNNADSIAEQTQEHSLKKLIEEFATDNIPREIALSCLIQLATPQTTPNPVSVLWIVDSSINVEPLIERVTELAPSNHRIGGAQASNVGIFGGVSQNEWKYKPGILTLSNHGHTTISQSGELGNAIQRSLANTISQRKFTVSKSDTNVTVPTKSPFLLTAHPEHGIFDREEPKINQIKNIEELISTISLTFLDDSDYESINAESHSDIELEKYLSICRRKDHPELTNEAHEVLVAHLSKTERIEGKEDLLRDPSASHALGLAEGISRLKLNESICEEDAEDAVELLTSYLEKAGFNPETGELDYEEVTTSSRAKLSKDVKDIVEELQKEYRDGVPIEEVIEIAIEDLGMDEERVNHQIEKLSTGGELYKPSSDHLLTL